MERELTLLRVEHPQFIDNDWIRVDHPTVEPLQGGMPTVGWEGDPRLVIYLHKPSQTFVLWRLEHDGEYRPTASISGDITPESINRLCARLVEIDQRRGFNAFQEVMDTQARQDAEVEQRRIEASNAFADKFLFGLARSHLPGVDIAKRTFTGVGSG